MTSERRALLERLRSQRLAGRTARSRCGVFTTELASTLRGAASVGAREPSTTGGHDNSQ